MTIGTLQKFIGIKKKKHQQETLGIIFNCCRETFLNIDVCFGSENFKLLSSTMEQHRFYVQRADGHIVTSHIWSIFSGIFK